MSKSEQELANHLFMTMNKSDVRTEHLNRTNGRAQPFNVIDEIISAVNIYNPVSITTLFLHYIPTGV
jgi:hypothetical protein